jgi:L-histidine N-alpha-methyltransferase
LRQSKLVSEKELEVFKLFSEALSINLPQYKTVKKRKTLNQATDEELIIAKTTLIKNIYDIRDTFEIPSILQPKCDVTEIGPAKSQGITAWFERSEFERNGKNFKKGELIFDGRIKKVVEDCRFEDWLLSFHKEGEGEKQNEMLGYLSGKLNKGEKKIVSGYSYWGIGPTNAWNLACHDLRYVVMKRGIDEFPKNWIKIYNSSLADKPYNYVCLGVGTGNKDVSILASLIEKNPDIKYFPIDMSPEMLHSGTIYVRRSMTKNLKNNQIWQTFPLQIDFSKKSNIEKIRNVLDLLVGEEPIIFSLLGNTLANFDCDRDLLKILSKELLKPDDILLLELAKTKAINDVAIKRAEFEYDHKAFRDFALSSLIQATNIDLTHMDEVYSRLEFKAKPEELPNKEIKALKISVCYKNKSQENQIIRLMDGDSLPFPSNDRIRLYLSRKYTREGIDDLIKYSNLEQLEKIPMDYPSENVIFGLELLLLKRLSI